MKPVLSVSRREVRKFRQRSRRRPFLVTLLALLVLTITGLYLLRFITTLSLWRFLWELPGVSPLYLALDGLVWAVIGLIDFWGLWYGRRWAPRATRVAAFIFVLNLWIERTVLAARSINQSDWPFVLGLTLVLLVFCFWTTVRASAYFGEMNDE